MTKLLKILFFIIILFYGCSDKVSNPSGETYNSNDVLIPLKIGNEWTYSHNVYSDDGNIMMHMEYTSKIEKDSTLKGTKYFFYYMPDSTNDIDDHWEAYSNKKTGLYKLLIYKNGLYNEELKFKYPGNIDDNYYNTEGKNTIESINSGVDVPAGYFTDCYMYSIKNETSITQTYYKPGVGMVLFQIYRVSNNKLFIQIKLNSYDLK